MLLISSSHEKQTAIKPRALETESFMSMNHSKEALSLSGTAPSPVLVMTRDLTLTVGAGALRTGTLAAERGS